ncbi:MAG: 3'-5' exonuclease [Pseudomonadota bacterium]
MNVFVFDIETIPDVDGGRRVYGLDGLSEKDTVTAMENLRQQENGTTFLRHHLQRIVAISAVLRTGNTLKVWSLGEEGSSEKELIERFFAGIEKYTPTLVSWNGGGFDLPVLHYRAMVHGVTAARYWDQGDGDRDFKWNNYISRYHARHTDLMDLISLYQGRAVVPLDQMASLLGFPGKMGMHGSKVYDAFRAGDIRGIRNYCETDVLNTFLVYLRFELMRGNLTREAHDAECRRVREYLKASGQPHLAEFEQRWTDLL